MKYKDLSILVTGGCGFIGGHIVEKLVEEGAKVTVIDKLLKPNSYFAQKKLKKSVNLQIVDIRNKDQVLKVFKKSKPVFVFHLAAEPVVERSYLDPYSTFETNIMGTVNILEAVRSSKKIKGVIVASSDKAYGKTKVSYTEESPLRGDHPYDVSKSCEDLISQTYNKTYNLPIVITRFANVYGEGDLNFGRIIPDICKAVIKKEILKLRSDGSFVRDYIYVKDAALGYLFLLNKLSQVKGEAFNFSSKDTLSVIDVVKKAEKILKVKIPIKILNIAKNEIPYQHLNDKKIRNLGWKTQNTLEDVLPQILIWYEALLTGKGRNGR